LLIVHLLSLAVFAAFRIADADEGVYLNAARMVSMGMSVYDDFFYTQLSMMPTVFAPLADNGWNSFFALRGLAALAGFFSAVLIAVIVLKTTRDYLSAVVTVFMYVFSGMIISWHAAFKALPFCHFLSLAAFLLWLLFREKRNTAFLVLCGLFLSALINFRSVFIVLLPPYIISILLLSHDKRLKNLIIFCLSLIPFALPTFLKILESSGRFFYGNVTFQLYREADRSLGFAVSNRIMTYLKALVDPHLLIVFALIALSVVLLIRNRRISGLKDLLVRPEGMALMNMGLIAAVHLLPHPMSRQYIEQYLGFGIIITGFNITQFRQYLEALFRPIYRRMFISILAVIYLLSLIPYTAIFIFGTRKDDRRYTLQEIRKVTDQMLALAGQSDTILSEWPGYLFLTRQTPLRYTEIIGSEYTLPLNHQEYMGYNLADRLYLRDQIEEKTPRLVVNVYKTPEYYAAALERSYEKAYQSDVVSIYKRK
jgi:hypothetical protein